VEPLLIGGAQERGRRGGTEHVAGIVGFGTAARLALLEGEERYQRWKEMRSRAVALIRDAFEHVVINGREDAVLPNILSVSFPSEWYPLDGEMLPALCDLNGLSLSSGSACTAGSVAPSHVMRAIGHSEGTAGASVRLSFGAMTTKEEVEEGTGILIRVVQDMVDPSNRRSHSRMTMP
jgi:cysteine desulfurase